MALANQVKDQNHTLFYSPGHRTLIIAGHGLASGGSNIFNYAMVEYINSHNIQADYLSLNFHNAETFLNTSIKAQAKMIDEYISKYKKQYSKIYLVGVSYSSLACLELNSQNVCKMACVLPSLNISLMWQMEKSRKVDIEGYDYFINFNQHVPILFDELLKKEGLTYNLNKSLELISQLQVPTLMVHAQNDEHYKLIKGFNLDTDFVSNKVIANADHDLMQVGVANKVVKDVLKFFECIE